MQIQLLKTTWTIGDPLPNGKGGFGSVHFASSSETANAVAKFFPKEPGATRELLIAGQLTAKATDNIVPILDSGEDKKSYVLVMPRAEMSLAQRLEQSQPVELAECLKILTDVAQALASLDGTVVHRDLKPQNILLLDGRWCLADFGISKYADAATAASPETRKGYQTHPYAAPELWHHKTATAATDVYAFGIMAYQILAGHLPFHGPTESDYRNQHLFDIAPPLTNGLPRLRVIISECLEKPMEIRPTAAALLSRLRKADVLPALPGEQKLALINDHVVAQQSKANAAQQKLEDLATTRAGLFDSAARMFESFSQPLLESIRDNAPTVKVQEGRGGGASLFEANLQGAKLGLSRPRYQEISGHLPFEVIASAVVSVLRERSASDGWIGRSHSLWFCDLEQEGRYGWYELSFMQTIIGLGGRRRDLDPFSLDPNSAADSFRNVLGGGQLAWPPTELDRDDPTEFLDRWLGWFADAATRRLSRPNVMPERNVRRTWRTR